MTISDIRQMYEKGTTVREVVTEAINRARKDQNSAVLEVIEARALERADELDARIKKNETIGRLAGVPFFGQRQHTDI